MSDSDIGIVSTTAPSSHITCNDDCRTVELTEKDSIHFSASDLRSPPVISFADDVPKLFREWYNSEAIMLSGRGVPIRYWDKLYKKKIAIPKLTKAWDSFRSTWGNWKVRLFPA